MQKNIGREEVGKTGIKDATKIATLFATDKRNGVEGRRENFYQDFIRKIFLSFPTFIAKIHFKSYSMDKELQQATAKHIYAQITNITTA